MYQRYAGAMAALLVLLLACNPAATPTATSVRLSPTPLATTLARATATPMATAAPVPAIPTVVPTAAPAGPKAGGIVRYPQREDPPSWDPSRLSAVGDYNQDVSAVFTHLFTTWSDAPANCRSEVYPWAVQTWRWVDDRTAEFTLKQGMRYQNKPPVNGREVVANDFVPAFARYQKNNTFMAGKSAVVESVTAKDKYTFQMKLKNPWGGMITELLASYYGPWLEPAEAGGASGELWERPDKSWIGSGAFTFGSWIPGVKWRLVRNPDYWVKDHPYLDAVEVAVVPDASTQLAALVSGQLDFIRDFNEELLDASLRRLPSLQVVRCPGAVGSVGMVWMDNSVPPFNDVRVRRAAVMAIDQQAIIDTFYKGRATIVPILPASTQFAWKVADFPTDVRQYVEYHPDRSKQLLADAGYPNGFDTVVNFTNRYAAPAPMIAEALVGMLGKGGIRAKVNMMDYGRFVSTVLQAKYPAGEMALTLTTARTPEDAHAFTTFWSGAGATNRSLVKDPEYDQLYERFRVTTDEKQRADLARQLQAMAASKAYAAHLPQGNSTISALAGIHFTWVGNTRDYSLLLETMWRDK